MAGVATKIIDYFIRGRNNVDVARSVGDSGAGANIDCDHAGPAGDDSPPMNGDFGIAVAVGHTRGSFVHVGYLDPKNNHEANQGERRLYSRNEEGESVAVIWLKNDGSIEVSNDAGSLELAPSGDIVANGVTIDTGGNITTSGTITGGEVKTQAGIDLALHTHGGVQTGGGSTGIAQ